MSNMDYAALGPDEIQREIDRLCAEQDALRAKIKSLVRLRSEAALRRRVDEMPREQQLAMLETLQKSLGIEPAGIPSEEKFGEVNKRR